MTPHSKGLASAFWTLILIAGVTATVFGVTLRMDDLEQRIEQLEAQHGQLNRLAMEVIKDADK